MSFTAADVKTLREMTSVGMMDCKKALVECDGDMDKAVEWLREKGLAKAAKKAGRIAAEGVSYALVENGVGALVEVNCETDFCAKSDLFVAFVKDIAKVIAEQDPADVDALMNCKYVGSDLTVSETMPEKVMSIGENLQIRRFVRFAENTSVGYVHAGGKIGVLVNLEVADELKTNETVINLGKDLAMQIAAMNPAYVCSEEVPADEVEKEKAVQLAKALEENASNTKMPEEKKQMIAEKKVAGRMNNYFAEVCLLNQQFVKESKMTVEQHVKAIAKEVGGDIKVVKFARFETGEGLEKKEEDFAAEVASMIK